MDIGTVIIVGTTVMGMAGGARVVTVQGLFITVTIISISITLISITQRLISGITTCTVIKTSGLKYVTRVIHR